MQHVRRLWIIIAAASLASACEGRRACPWDLEALAKPPAVTWLDRASPVASALYEGEPYRGRPTQVWALVGMPEGRSGPVPGMVLIHGGGGTAFREWVMLWVARGYAAIAMDLAGKGPDGKPLPNGGPDQGHPQKFDGLADGVTNAWPYHAVAAAIRAVSLLGSLEGVDAKRLGVTGISWGGYLTCIVAGIDARLKVAVPVYGCGFLHENSCWLGEFAKLGDSLRDSWVEAFDPSRYLGGCRMPILFINGTNDFAYPLDSYQKSYRLVRGPRTLSVQVGLKHSHPDGWAPREIALFVDAALRGAAPLAAIASVSRAGTAVTASFSAAAPIRAARLHYTTDTGTWQGRAWRTVPAELGSGEARAALPVAAGVVYFMTLEDDRGAIVSTEHETIPPAPR